MSRLTNYHEWAKNRNTACYYNPVTNHLVTNLPHSPSKDYYCLGYKKIAEAFTTVSPEERPQLFDAWSGGWINLSKLSSKIRSKLKRVRINQSGDFKWLSDGESLLLKIKQKSRK